MLCFFAESSRYYYLLSNTKYKENDYKLEEIDDALLDDMYNIGRVYFTDIKLIPKKNLTCRKTP